MGGQRVTSLHRKAEPNYKSHELCPEIKGEQEKIEISGIT